MSDVPRGAWPPRSESAEAARKIVDSVRAVLDNWLKETGIGDKFPGPSEAQYADLTKVIKRLIDYTVMRSHGC
jgi:hypothetical protein